MPAGKAYHFGSPVADPYFCDRETETGAVARCMRGGTHVFVLGPRRYGKSSVVLRAADAVAAEGGLVARADLARCAYSHDVASEVLRAVVAELGLAQRAARSLGRLLRGLRVQPELHLGADGRFDVSFDAERAARSWPEMFDDAVTLLADQSARRTAVLVVDEFQAVAGKGMDRRWPGLFKSAADRLQHASLALCGSRRRVMDDLVRHRTAPLYGMGQVVALGEIPEEEIVAYLVRRAAAVGGQMSQGTARLVCERGGPVPHYVQQLADAAYRAAPGGTIDAECVERGTAGSVALQESDFIDLYASLAPGQRRLLQVLAAEPTEHPYASEFVRKVEVTARSVTVSLEVLEEAGLVLRRGSTWFVPDPFMRAWLVAKH
ncbi:MAG: AAA family ATPase [Acidimicrobiales bacterium]